MAEALLEREISRLKKKIQEKDDRIHALELISSDAAHPPSSSRPDAIANIPPPDLESGLSKLRSALQCAICVELFTEPHTVDCGHTFCYPCLKQWLQIRKQCPTCRKTLTRRPMLSFTVQHQVEIYVSHLGSKTEKEHHRKRLENGKEKADPWENIFHRERKTTYIEDADDDTRRCPQCNWELVGQECVNCGEMYYDAPEDSDEGESVNTRDENESDMDDSHSVDSFVVDDDVVDYDDDEDERSASEDHGTASEEEIGHRTRSNRKNHSRSGRSSRGSHNRPAIVELDSNSDDDESDGSHDDDEKDEGLNSEDQAKASEEEIDRRTKRNRRSRNSKSRDKPAIVELDSTSDEKEDNIAPSNGHEDSQLFSDHDSDFQIPAPRPKKRKIHQKAPSRKNRRLIAIDDSDDDGLPETSQGRSKLHMNGHGHIQDESSSKKKSVVQDTSSSDEEDGSDEEDLEQALHQLNEQYSSQAVAESTEKQSKAKKNKKKKKKKKSKSHGDHGKRKDKGKGPA